MAIHYPSRGFLQRIRKEEEKRGRKGRETRKDRKMEKKKTETLEKTVGKKNIVTSQW